MGIRRVKPADDARPAGKLYPQDRHSRSHPHHDAPPTGSDGWDGQFRKQSSPYEMLDPKGDARRQVGAMYSFGRVYPGGKWPHDYSAPEPTPKMKPIARDQSQPQVREARTSDHGDTKEAWARGMSKQSPQHPFFDRGLSGSRYRK
jgi:hypothetical protein